jgi:hypothetical protein
VPIDRAQTNALTKEKIEVPFMIRLLGISHSFQFRPTKDCSLGGPVIDADQVRCFEKYLHRSIDEKRPEMLSGEASEPTGYEYKQSVAKLADNALKLEHRYCDPNPEERRTLYAKWGITESGDCDVGYPIRARFWLDRIRPGSDCATVLFICGVIMS